MGPRGVLAGGLGALLLEFAQVAAADFALEFTRSDVPDGDDLGMGDGMRIVAFAPRTAVFTQDATAVLTGAHCLPGGAHLEGTGTGEPQGVVVASHPADAVAHLEYYRFFWHHSP